MTGQTTVRHTAPPAVVRGDRPTAVPQPAGPPVAEGEARLVTGEPGCGRSRFLDRAARAFTAGPVAHVRADPACATVPYGGLRALLGLLAPPHAHEAAAPPPAGLDGRPADTVLRSALCAASAGGPLLVCVDDAHLWDPASRSALGRLGRDPRAAGAVSLLLTVPGHRPVDPEFAGVPRLRLDPLTAAASAALLDAETGGGIDRDVRDGLVAEAEGNPALLLALLRSLTPAQVRGRAPLPRPLADAEILTGLVGDRLGALTDEEHEVLLTAAAAVREAEDGSTAVAPVRRALARLTGGAPAARLDPPPDLLVVSGGRLRFRSTLVRRALYARAGERGRRAAHRALAAQEAGLPGLLHHAWAAPADATTTADGPAVSRARAAGLAGAAADPAVPASPRLRCAALARAADLTGDGHDRARYRLAAARQALLAGQPHRALRLLDAVRTDAPDSELRGRAELLRGAALLRDGPVDEARATLLLAKSLLAAHAPDAALAAALGAADAAWAAGDVPGCLEALTEGQRDGGGGTGDPGGPRARLHPREGAGTPARPALGNTAPAASTASAVSGACADDVLREHRRGMLALLERRFGVAVGSLRRVVDGAAPGDRADLLLRAAAAALLMGDLVGARGAATAALVAARTQGEAAALGPALEYLAYTELRAGRHGLARTHAEEGLRAALRAGQRNTAAHHHAAQALAASIDGDADAVARHVRHAQEISLRHGLAQAATLAEWALARADLGDGRPAEAADRLGPLVRPGPRRGHFAVWMLAVPCYVEAAARAGQGGSAGPVVEEFAEWARFGADPQAPAQLLRCRALLAPPDRADGLYEDALALHETAGGDFERARTELLYGQWLRRRRRLREARDHLGAALVGFERCGARAWAEQTRAELRANGTSAGGARAGDLSALTPQQLRIVRHVAAGATNREIAQALTVSTRTVDYHLRKVFAALGVRSRVELARLVEQTEKTPAHP
ncbi:helix-turn-helix transcriptional regulator [Streptomyces galbus]|uniref:helix-turn-helix transcriptional regulator n=1 Tax=Streptomyces galbus TaxID=33898 RepID=UPI001672EBD6|nr:helix-turn-helix transcriptional regulator [Streptomyces galbus]GHD25731.1 helix-turn-helix transcriptional regulator [Streptomyces galbus]